jgi:single-strand DNA-binding protein
MSSLNKVLLIGNLTRDPELRNTPQGKAVAHIGIAVNESYTTPDGEKKEDVTFVDVVCWGRQAETCKEYLTKGSLIFVEGKLQLDSWEKDGEKKSRMRVRADRVQFLSSKNRPKDKDEKMPDEYAGRKDRNSQPVDDDDIPF